MKILILSDNHYKDLDIKNKYDYIIHAGDYGNMYEYLINNNILFVSGNCDYLGERERIININNKKIFLTHGDKYRVKETMNSLYYKALSLKCDIVIFGHTHIPFCTLNDNILFINPGAYKEGYYVIIKDDKISFYRYDNKLNEINYRR